RLDNTYRVCPVRLAVDGDPRSRHDKSPKTHKARKPVAACARQQTVESLQFLRPRRAFVTEAHQCRASKRRPASYRLASLELSQHRIRPPAEAVQPGLARGVHRS